ncbi:hypothetical protein ABL78_0717 [Leptomonas seymouri]|uniref:Uncharacterized protein n=1 Tax=Leptomonas seymouri TaxID=5684 RepID=A0A0N0P8P9_LEPSE|nr:hypothetical protein ABL78_0717 [Leptomonas seymouri]|eukprot:KPI90199.1 hypothetical protein ABL78_0717 [Leptomonas seymouri]
MPAPAVHTLFGFPDLKVNAHLLANLAFMASSDKPMESPTLSGGYAMSEMCVSDAETAELKMYLETLRSNGQKTFVSRIVEKLRGEAAQTRNQAVAAAADTIEADYARLLKVLFLRARSYDVIKVSTDKPVGRFVCFPDQISDDFGNNLEEHSEAGVIQSLVARSRDADKLPTVYVGHGQGAVMAVLCGCATGSQSILFDGTILSTLLVANAVEHKCVQCEPDECPVPREFNLINYRTEAMAKKQDAVVKSILKAAGEVKREEKAAEARKNGEEKKENKKDERDLKDEEQQKAAAAWIESSEWYKIGAIVSPSASGRFEKTGRYAAKALSNMLADYTATIRPSENPLKQQQ